jgi:hypothetical protein
MKRTAAVLAVGVFVLTMAAPAFSGQRHRRHRPHRRPVPVWSDFNVRFGSPRISFDITIPGSPYYAPRRVWVPGQWEYVREWVPGRYERVWVPDRRGPYGNRRSGYYREGYSDGEYRQKQVWREGRYR